MYDATVFDKIHTLVPSHRGELEITDVNNAYIREGNMTFSYLEGWWTDAGTFDSLLRAANLVAQSVAGARNAVAACLMAVVAVRLLGGADCSAAAGDLQLAYPENRQGYRRGDRPRRFARPDRRRAPAALLRLSGRPRVSLWKCSASATGWRPDFRRSAARCRRP